AADRRPRTRGRRAARGLTRRAPGVRARRRRGPRRRGLLRHRRPAGGGSGCLARGAARRLRREQCCTTADGARDNHVRPIGASQRRELMSTARTWRAGISAFAVVITAVVVALVATAASASKLAKPLIGESSPVGSNPNQQAITNGQRIA